MVSAGAELPPDPVGGPEWKLDHRVQLGKKPDSHEPVISRELPMGEAP